MSGVGFPAKVLKPESEYSIFGPLHGLSDARFFFFFSEKKCQGAILDSSFEKNKVRKGTFGIYVSCIQPKVISKKSMHEVSVCAT